ncbi:hypothetical protein [Spirosoma endophyticum]|uniref:hypothetical protein n=1 Tax=Spirosoma endophyticum TaxID=662367 RepID=UPI0015A65AC3|nr:hypothetical protein [Spirosoma endophyticum]
MQILNGRITPGFGKSPIKIASAYGQFFKENTLAQMLFNVRLCFAHQVIAVVFLNLKK